MSLHKKKEGSDSSNEDCDDHFEMPQTEPQVEDLMDLVANFDSEGGPFRV